MSDVATIGEIINSVATVANSLGGAAAAQANTKVQHAQAKADIATYQTYLDQFPGYAAAKETQFTTQQNQVLGDRLAAMGMRGIQTGGAGAATSSAAVYSAEKSLWDTGYQQLVQSLGLQKQKAEGQLKVAQETLGETNTGGLAGHGGGLNPNPVSDFFGLG